MDTDVPMSDSDTSGRNKRKNDNNEYEKQISQLEEQIRLLKIKNIDLVQTGKDLSATLNAMEEDMKDPVKQLSENFDMIAAEIEALKLFVKNSNATEKFLNNSGECDTTESWIADFENYAPVISGLIDLLLFNNKPIEEIPEKSEFSLVKFIILGNILSKNHPSWRSEISFHIELVHKSITQSDLASQILSKLLPGAYASRSLSKNIDKYVSNEKAKQKSNLRSLFMKYIIYTYDNIQIMGGKPARAGTQMYIYICIELYMYIYMMYYTYMYDIIYV